MTKPKLLDQVRIVFRRKHYSLYTERRKALKDLLSLEAPIADWDQMEEEIIRGAVEG